MESHVRFSCYNLDSGRSICDKFKESSFCHQRTGRTKHQKEKKQAMCSENFQGMSQKKIKNKQSDIKLTWSNHKTWFLL